MEGWLDRAEFTRARVRRTLLACADSRWVRFRWWGAGQFRISPHIQSRRAHCHRHWLSAQPMCWADARQVRRFWFGSFAMQPTAAHF